MQIRQWPWPCLHRFHINPRAILRVKAVKLWFLEHKCTRNIFVLTLTLRNPSPSQWWRHKLYIHRHVMQCSVYATRFGINNFNHENMSVLFSFLIRYVTTRTTFGNISHLPLIIMCVYITIFSPTINPKTELSRFWKTVQIYFYLERSQAWIYSLWQPVKTAICGAAHNRAGLQKGK